MLLIDADLGIVLQQVSSVDGVPAVRLELRDLTLTNAAEDEAVFSLDLPPGTRVIESGGDLWHELDLPAPVLAAGAAAGSLLRAAVARAFRVANARRPR